MSHDPELDEVLRRGAFFAETHTIKAWQAREALVAAYPSLAEPLRDALSWNQVLAAPRAAARFASLVEFDLTAVADRRLRAMIECAVFPASYAASAEWIRRHGLRSLVDAHADVALARLGFLGHSFTVHASFLELAQWLESRVLRGTEHEFLAGERYAEFVASQLSRVDAVRPDADVAAAGESPEAASVIDEALRKPGYFGHSLITAGVLARSRDRLDAPRRAYGWRAMQAMIAAEGPSAVAAESLDGVAGDVDLEDGLRDLLVNGPREAHTITLARALLDLAQAFPRRIPALVATARAFARWGMKRNAGGERATG